MSTTVKQHDTHTVTFTVGVNLTGATVRILAKKGSDPVVVLANDATDLAAGVITHTLTGTLPPGDYRVEVEITRNGVVQTAPTTGYARLTVLRDLD